MIEIENVCIYWPGKHNGTGETISAKLYTGAVTWEHLTGVLGQGASNLLYNFKVITTSLQSTNLTDDQFRNFITDDKFVNFKWLVVTGILRNPEPTVRTFLTKVICQ